MSGEPFEADHNWFATHHVVASNLSRQSENRIHDDAVAKGLGFTGSLVPGVEIYAYACHLITRFWGRDWLERGGAQCRFLKPIYDGHAVVATARSEGRETLSVRVESDGVLCALVQAERGQPAPSIDTAAYRRLDIPRERPMADEISLAPGTWLGTVSLDVTRELAESYLKAVFEPDALYCKDGILHPGQILRLCNQALIRNVILDVWVHTASLVRHLDVARFGETLSVRAQVVANYEHRGHSCVDLDILVLANEARPIAHVTQNAIYKLKTRQPS